METQKIKTDQPILNGRIESGPLKINDDLTGYFIRGDHAEYIAMLVRNVKKQIGKNTPFEFFELLANIEDLGRVQE